MTHARAEPTRARLIAAFAAVYLIWGSTYLAIRFAIETLPPFLMAGTRFLVAGAILYAFTRARGAARPTRAHWRSTAIVGALLLWVGNGGVTWAEQWVPSGVTALLVATVPFWMVLADWLRPGGTRPGAMVVGGLLLGFTGLVILIGPASWPGGEGVHPLGAAVLMVSTVAWSVGSIYSRGADLPERPLQATGMEMLAGGALLTALGLASGEAARFDPGTVSLRSWLALLYLIVFGSLVGFSAYIWLLGVTAPARAATYAYVNPVVAVLLGWGLAGETLAPRTLAAVVVIIGAVALITTARGRVPAAAPNLVAAHEPQDSGDETSSPDPPDDAPGTQPVAPRPT